MADKYRMSNKEVVLILKEVLAAMEVKNFNYFKIRAYQNAIAVIDNLTNSIYDVWENGKLDDVPGIGGGLTQHFTDLFTKGKVIEFEKAKEGLPEGMFALIGLRGVGAKKAFKLAEAFKLDDRTSAIEKLKEAAITHKIQVLEGFGEKSESGILDSIEQTKLTKNEKPRMLLVHAESVGARVLDWMSQIDEISKMEFSGSFRRRNETVGDLDLIVATTDEKKTIDHFVTFPEVHEVLAQGDKKAMVVLKNDVQVDIRISTPQAYGALIQYNTGSKQHNILLRTYALENGYSLSEYGIKVKKTDEVLEFDNEEDFYKKLNLPYIPPELRNGTDEIERAIQGKLPKLVRLEDIRGDLHTHTTASDGVRTLDEMLTSARALGYEYYGVSDHSPSVQTRGYAEVENIIEQRKKIIKEISEKSDMKVLFGYEVNILADATMALPDEMLKELDYALGGLHTSFNQTREEITKRLLCAIENPFINIIAHPSGRLINERDPVDPDWSKVLDAVKANNKILEIDSQPNRLDLTFDLVRECVDRDIKLIVSSDAHDIDQLLYLRYGIDVARRGWCEAKNIVNCLGFEDLISVFRKGDSRVSRNGN